MNLFIVPKRNIFLVFTSLFIIFQVHTAKSREEPTPNPSLLPMSTNKLVSNDNLSCNQSVTITLNDDCEAEVTISSVLTGEFDGLTAQDFVITVVDGNTNNGALVDGCGSFEYVVEIVAGVDANFTTCWGSLTAEDKTAPTLSCPTNRSQVTVDGELRDLLCTDINEVFVDGIDSYVVHADGSIVMGTLSSNLENILSYTGYPIVTDNCGQVLVKVWDSVLHNGDCGETVITRHFEVSDQYDSPCDGLPMTNECTQIITLRKASLMADVNLPEAAIELDCDTDFVLDENGNPSPFETGYVTVTSAFDIHHVDDVYCNITTIYDDGNRIDNCGVGYEFTRNWQVIDWCDPGQVISFSQVINVGDNEGPQVTCEADAITYSTGAFECAASFYAPLPEVVDNCSGYEVLTQIFSSDGDDVLVLTIPADASSRFVSGIDIGCYFYRYSVVDDCGNTTVVDCPFVVEDQVAPTAACNTQLSISIGNETARIFANDVDEGSSDNCSSDVKLEVRRSYPNGSWSVWADYIDFTCADVHEFVTIELRVWDDKNGDGIPGNTVEVTNCGGEPLSIMDNENMCWMEIQVADEISPVCVPPHDETLHCSDVAALQLVQNLENEEWLNTHFGNGSATDNCDAAGAQVGIINGLTDCGWGTITRQFNATDEWGMVSSNTCSQVITIYEVHDYEIKFPKDAWANCAIPDPDTIEIFANACDLFAVNVNTEYYDVAIDGAYSGNRTYRLINWCEYDGTSPPISVGRDEDEDGDSGNEDVYVIIRTTWENDTPILSGFIDNDRDEQNGYWRTTNSVGHWAYSQLFVVYDSIAPVVEIDPSTPLDFCSYDFVNCRGYVSVNFTVSEECTPWDVSVDGSIISSDTEEVIVEGEYPNYTISGNFPIGHHVFEIRVSDRSGNTFLLNHNFNVVDCKAPSPSPICISGLAINLMPVISSGGEMQLWATDFVISIAASDCSGVKGYSIHKEVDIMEGTDIPAFPHPSIDLTCEDLSITMVRVYVWDDAFNPYSIQPDGSVGGSNYDYCETYVLVQDWDGACDTSGLRVAGFIRTENDLALEGVTVSITGSDSSVGTTNSSGRYELGSIENGADITITPQYQDFVSTEVSTFDIVLISKHILGTQLLDSPYKLIAADVNNSGSVTALDLIAIRRVILGMVDGFPNNVSCRFVDEAYEFPEPTNPWAEDFPEVVSINNINTHVLDANFVAIKIGDVSGN